MMKLTAGLLLCGALLASSSAFAAPAYSIREGCSYPDGWNSGDLIREINGIPNGIHHQCIDTYQNGRLIHRQKAELDY
jgi:hypothetical protein